MFNVVEQPGLLFVYATLLPLASFTLLLLWAAVRWALRPYARAGGGAAGVFQALGGENPGRAPAYVALAAIVLACACSVTGFAIYLGEHAHNEAAIAEHEHKIRELEEKQHDLTGKAKEKAEEDLLWHRGMVEHYEARWAGSVVWASIRPQSAKQAWPENASLDKKEPPHEIGGFGTLLKLGFRIDMLAAVMFVMVTFIASWIHLFSIGYMADELGNDVADHQVHVGHHHLHRRGRFGRFFMFLSLFCFSMLNLLLADNLFQVFVSWELVGVCSYLLVSFYYERTSASNAANKAFIVNRVGDAGFLIGLMILWTHVGTFDFHELFHRLRYESGAAPAHAPQQQAHEQGKSKAGHFLYAERGEHVAGGHTMRLLDATERRHATDVLVLPRVGPHPEDLPATVVAHDVPGPHQFSAIPYWMLVLAGLGIFLGCVGKSAQFPLHVWLPDAMEGPTPVSALIHAATMVAAGVYLVGRCYPLFLPEVTLTIAYVGGITLFVAATIAVVMDDIKKVLAYSTVSQLGYMMLGLGVGGWSAGLFHLITHAFFKALLFLGSGAVIYGCHHEQNMLKMGGLYPKMKITAITMLVGVLTIAGIPFFSGWYSKDSILVAALTFVEEGGISGQREHYLLFLLPLITAGITTFYMFRMWFLTFAGAPRDYHVYDHAHEPPAVMWLPLAVLAVLSVCVAWGWPVWEADKSYLEGLLHHTAHPSLAADFGKVVRHDTMHLYHNTAGNLALGMVGLGIAFAVALYYFRALDPAEAKDTFPGVHRFLTQTWYFDQLYSVIFVRPTLTLAHAVRVFDGRVIDGIVNGVARVGVFVSRLSGRFDNGIVDGLVNLFADVWYAIGAWLRTWQTGYIRSYVLFLVLAAVGLWVLLSFLLSPSAFGGP